MVLVVAGVFFLVGGIWATIVYNGLIRAKNLVNNAFSQIDVQLKRRYDLIPNLVETAKAFMKHEQQTLTAVIQARNQASSLLQNLKDLAANPQLTQDFFNAESNFSGALGRLLVSVEAYPQLKSDQTMSRLMEELTSTENKISFARQAYNDAVMSYNNSREVFPTNLIASQLNLPQAVAYEAAQPQERETIRVSFSA